MTSVKDYEILKEINRLKKRVLVGFCFCFISYMVLIFIFNFFYPHGYPPVWLFWILGTLPGLIFIFPPARKLSNVQCPHCGRPLKLKIFFIPKKIMCLSCGMEIRELREQRTKIGGSRLPEAFGKGKKIH